MLCGRPGTFAPLVLSILAAWALEHPAPTFAAPPATPASGLLAKPGSASPPRTDDLVAWSARWKQPQAALVSVSIGDHWRVCELKFRFRHYRDLFECLDLMEARAARLDTNSPEYRYAPVLLGWMRAQAYGEVGEDDKALSAVESAWDHLPQDYRDVSSGVSECHSFPQALGYWFCRMGRKDEFQEVAIEAGGELWEERGSYDLLRLQSS